MSGIQQLGFVVCNAEGRAVSRVFTVRDAAEHWAKLSGMEGPRGQKRAYTQFHAQEGHGIG